MDWFFLVGQRNVRLHGLATTPQTVDSIEKHEQRGHSRNCYHFNCSKPSVWENWVGVNEVGACKYDQRIRQTNKSQTESAENFPVLCTIVTLEAPALVEVRYLNEVQLETEHWHKTEYHSSTRELRFELIIACKRVFVHATTNTDKSEIQAKVNAHSCSAQHKRIESAVVNTQTTPTLFTRQNWTLQEQENAKCSPRSNFW